MSLNIKQKFSLLELLVVMAISAVMLSIIVPSFLNTTKGVNVEMGARQLGAQLKAVREYAITNRKYVALIMCSSSLPTGYQYSAYRPCIVSSTTWSAGGTISINSEWVEGERWEFLPAGVIIKSISEGKEIDGITDTSINLENQTVSNCIVFTPTGKAEGVNASGAQINVGAGKEEDGTATNSSNNITITVAGYTGRISYGDN